MLKIENDTEELEKEFRSLTMGIENISEKNKKILKNNQYIKLLKDIDIDKIQNIEINEKQSYDGLQADLGTSQRGRSGVEKTYQKVTITWRISALLVSKPFQKILNKH